MIKQESRTYFRALGAHVTAQQRFVVRIIDVLEDSNGGRGGAR